MNVLSLASLSFCSIMYYTDMLKEYEIFALYYCYVIGISTCLYDTRKLLILKKKTIRDKELIIHHIVNLSLFLVSYNHYKYVFRLLSLEITTCALYLHKHYNNVMTSIVLCSSWILIRLIFFPFILNQIYNEIENVQHVLFVFTCMSIMMCLNISWTLEFVIKRYKCIPCCHMNGYSSIMLFYIPVYFSIICNNRNNYTYYISYITYIISALLHTFREYDNRYTRLIRSVDTSNVALYALQNTMMCSNIKYILYISLIIVKYVYENCEIHSILTIFAFALMLINMYSLLLSICISISILSFILQSMYNNTIYKWIWHISISMCLGYSYIYKYNILDY